MGFFAESDHERDLAGQPHQAQVPQSPSVVGFNAQAGPGGEKSIGQAGARDSVVADENAADQAAQLILFLGAGAGKQAQQRPQNRSEKQCALHLTSREVPRTNPASRLARETRPGFGKRLASTMRGGFGK